MSETLSESTSGAHERVAGGTTVVKLSGEIDILTVPTVSARLDALTADPCPGLVLDLGSVTFIDCAGLSALCRARNRVLERGGRLTLVACGARVLRVLRLTRLTTSFDICSGLPEALARTADPVEAGAAAR